MKRFFTGYLRYSGVKAMGLPRNPVNRLPQQSGGGSVLTDGCDIYTGPGSTPAELFVAAHKKTAGQ
ncbi:hypothetical protein BOH73_17925 [Pseudomonas versuta]|uniref:Uncharacterized protein n=1 Tax=Pseudomonas versuta TaxID=1788301 RepID=A0ABX3E6Y6_9PSED|nr:hypothetical protein AOC04_05875 [Pseudomonas versuta]OKA19019.1 hypothetical protein BOH73_17925 [Pseudomonas versuta]